LGIGNSASSISGSPYHTRVIELDGSGGNQDRALAAAAVVYNTLSGDVSGPIPACPLTTNTYIATTDTTNVTYNLVSHQQYRRSIHRRGGNQPVVQIGNGATGAFE